MHSSDDAVAEVHSAIEMQVVRMMVVGSAVGRVVTVVRNGARISVMQDAVDGDPAVDARVPIVRVVARVGVFFEAGQGQRRRRARVEFCRRADF